MHTSCSFDSFDIQNRRSAKAACAGAVAVKFLQARLQPFPPLRLNDSEEVDLDSLCCFLPPVELACASWPSPWRHCKAHRMPRWNSRSPVRHERSKPRRAPLRLTARAPSPRRSTPRGGAARLLARSDRRSRDRRSPRRGDRGDRGASPQKPSASPAENGKRLRDGVDRPTRKGSPAHTSPETQRTLIETLVQRRQLAVLTKLYNLAAVWREKKEKQEVDGSLRMCLFLGLIRVWLESMRGNAERRGHGASNSHHGAGICSDARGHDRAAMVLHAVEANHESHGTGHGHGADAPESSGDNIVSGAGHDPLFQPMLRGVEKLQVPGYKCAWRMWSRCCI
eukprot:s8479_g2.t1